MKKILLFLIMFILIFLILIRGSVYLFQHDYNYINSIILSISAIIIIIFIILKFYFRHVRFKYVTTIVFILLMIYLYYCLFPTGNNYKSDDIKKEYTSLHPILRLGVGTLFIFDKKSIMTDGTRSLENCEKMNIKYNSAHKINEDGFGYAVDISIRDRTKIRNFFVEYYFVILGYYSLRHDQGYGDHLHISLQSNLQKYK